MTFGKKNWEILIENIKDKRCTPFLGAGACVGKIPLGKEIAEEWAKKNKDHDGYPFKDSDNLVSVSQFLAVTMNDPTYPKNLMKKKIESCLTEEKEATEAFEIHDTLASLPIKIYMTTNYDDLMFKALRKRIDKTPRKALCFWNDELQSEKPSIYLFNWEEIPGKDNSRLIKYLMQDFGIYWARTAEIKKIDSMRRKITNGKNFLSLELNDEKTKVSLEIDDGRKHEFILKSENGKLNVYDNLDPTTDEDYYPSIDNPVVYYLHGFYKIPESLVLTEDDYTKFIVNVSRYQDMIPPYIQEAFTDTSLLFLGYRMADPDFRALFQNLVGYLDRSRIPNHFSIQREKDSKEKDSKEEKKYNEKYFEKLDTKVYWKGCSKFMNELKKIGGY